MARLQSSLNFLCVTHLRTTATNQRYIYEIIKLHKISETLSVILLRTFCLQISCQKKYPED
jgi:hypothetical protein